MTVPGSDRVYTWFRSIANGLKYSIAGADETGRYVKRFENVWKVLGVDEDAISHSAIENSIRIRPVQSSSCSSGVYICKSVVNDLKHGNYICKSEENYLTYEYRIEIPVDFPVAPYSNVIPSTQYSRILTLLLVQERDRSHVRRLNQS